MHGDVVQVALEIEQGLRGWLRDVQLRDVGQGGAEFRLDFIDEPFHVVGRKDRQIAKFESRIGVWCRESEWHGLVE